VNDKPVRAPVEERGAVYKLLAAAMGSVIVTGAASWLVFGQDKVTRSEMESYVHNQGPWIRQREVIQAAVERNSGDIASIAKSVDELVKSQGALLVEQRILVTRFEAYLRLSGREGGSRDEGGP